MSIIKLSSRTYMCNRSPLGIPLMCTLGFPSIPVGWHPPPKSQYERHLLSVCFCNKQLVHHHHDQQDSNNDFADCLPLLKEEGEAKPHLFRCPRWSSETALSKSETWEISDFWSWQTMSVPCKDYLHPQTVCLEDQSDAINSSTWALQLWLLEEATDL